MASNKRPDHTTPSAGKLQHELKKKKPFESLAQEAWLNLVRTHSQLQIRFERMLGEYGLTGCQYNILRILRGEGHPLPILEVASRTISPVPGRTVDIRHVFSFLSTFPLSPLRAGAQGGGLNQVVPTVMSNREVLLPRVGGPARLLSNDINLPKLNAVTSHCHS